MFDKKPSADPEAVVQLYMLRGMLADETQPEEDRKKMSAAVADARNSHRALSQTHGEEMASIGAAIVMLEVQCGMLPPA